jgi:type IV secretion system protein VirD4
MAFVVEHPAYSDRASLGVARQLLMQSNDALQRTIRTAIGLGPESVAAGKLAQFELPKDKESTSIMSVISAARTQTAFLDSPVLNRSMDRSDFSFEELCGGNASVYLVLPPDKLETYARWLRLMVSAGIRAVARGAGRSKAPAVPQGAHGLPVLFVLDEFGTIGKLNAVAQAYGLMAGLGMIMWAFAQDINQLARDYPQHWETFIANSQAVTCFGVMDNSTAEYISKMLGTSTIEHTNVSTSMGKSVAPRSQNAPFFQSQRTSIQTSTSYSTQVMSRALLNPDEIRGLGGEFSLIIGRHPPILCRRIVYHQDWTLLHRALPDPHFPRTEDVRWQALRKTFYEVGSVAALLAQLGYEVKGLRGGCYEVTGAGKAARTFASANDLWRWTYILVMDDVDSA